METYELRISDPFEKTAYLVYNIYYSYIADDKCVFAVAFMNQSDDRIVDSYVITPGVEERTWEECIKIADDKISKHFSDITDRYSKELKHET